VDAFHKLFETLPRLCPGSDASTSRAIRRLPSPRLGAKILDVGCGKGRSTVILAQHYKAPVIGVDIHQPYLDALEAAAKEAGVAKLVSTRCAKMDALDFSANSFDVIWSEGAVHLLGVSRAMREWQEMLRYGGSIAFSELSWLRDDPPLEAKEFWAKRYRDMATMHVNKLKIEAEGLFLIDMFPLPAQDAADYYTRLEQRVTELQPEAEGSPEMAAVLADAEAEIDIYKKHGAFFGYVFYMARRDIRTK
jgi:serine/threonine-protein kinase HipA